MIPITFVHRKDVHTVEMPPDATVTDLANRIQNDLLIPVEQQKFMVPKMPFLKAPFGNRPITDLQDKKITLIGSTNAEVTEITAAAKNAEDRRSRLALSRLNPPKARRTQPVQREEDKYTFLELRPLQNLPRPERSLAFLERLKADPGIRAAMVAHKFTVGLLTEMDPLSYTESSHEGTTRILGLNRNKGEVIELRLRTDAYDGYRDYKTIRNTLCHELTHNVHSDHDRAFYDLCGKIEKQVANYSSGGRTVGEGPVYTPGEEVADDRRGWTGGEFRLGAFGPPKESAGAESTLPPVFAAMRKEALERLAKTRQAEKEEEEEKQADP
ncbi:WLM domain-containing protein [Xylaria cf. heliscus]|nr:WLM domain-containing protein [Xylaria cf. heliscus]